VDGVTAAGTATSADGRYAVALLLSLHSGKKLPLWAAYSTGSRGLVTSLYKRRAVAAQAARSRCKVLSIRTLIFLPCDAMRCTVFVIVILSVCLSVCLSHSWSCVHMVRPTITISSPYGSTIILVCGDIEFIPKFEGDHPERGR